MDIHIYFPGSDAHLDQVMTWYMKRGIPVVFGEFSSENELAEDQGARVLPTDSHRQ